MSKRSATTPRKRGSTFAVLASILVLLGAGGVMIYLGLQPGEPEPAPLPSAFTASPVPRVSIDAAAAKELPPNSLSIPDLGVQAPLLPGEVVTQDGERTLDIPGDPAKLTRYAGGAKPCSSEGTVLVAGHVSSYGVHGALWSLSEIEANAPVAMTCDDGTITTWQVVSVDVTPKAALPQDIFTESGPLRAVLVTCGGPVLADGHYRDNVIVELAPVEA